MMVLLSTSAFDTTNQDSNKIEILKKSIRGKNFYRFSFLILISIYLESELVTTHKKTKKEIIQAYHSHKELLCKYKNSDFYIISSKSYRYKNGFFIKLKEDRAVNIDFCKVFSKIQIKHKG
jgi:NMD protein affecting ribosome stability and mRNA decay